MGRSILPPSQQEAAANAFAALEPYGVSLNEVVADWISPAESLGSSITYEAAMDAFLEYRRRSTSYTRSIRQTRNRLVVLHGRLLNEITPETLTRAMDGMTPSVRNFTIRILGRALQLWASNGDSARRIQSADSTFRNAIQPKSRFTRSRGSGHYVGGGRYADGLVPFLAVSFFCGIRRAEALRLDWSAIDLHENCVKLPASITKTKRGRHIEISANAGRGSYHMLRPVAGFILTPRACSVGACVHSARNMEWRRLNRAHGTRSHPTGSRCTRKSTSFAGSLGITTRRRPSNITRRLRHGERPKSFGRSCRRVGEQSKVVAFTGEKGAA